MVVRAACGAASGSNLRVRPASRSAIWCIFRSSACDMLQRWGIAWHYQSPRGTLIAQDDVDHWTLQTRPKPGDDLDRVNPNALLTRFMGGAIPCEILVANPWTPHLLVAEAYRQGRVF